MCVAFGGITSRLLNLARVLLTRGIYRSSWLLRVGKSFSSRSSACWRSVFSDTTLRSEGSKSLRLAVCV